MLVVIYDNSSEIILACMINAERSTESLQVSSTHSNLYYHKGIYIFTVFLQVTSWIVGIKKLVVTSQQALIENNKFIEDNKFS